MIQELQDIINLMDTVHNEKGKKLFLKIAELPENKQEAMISITKTILGILT
ncbi:MAG: hypothetical protein WC307_05095 [Candidatus Nanoarchaeia archaeon]|jgi:hypothetical protein